ncbi:hypothetical protein [Natronorubrum bangense]|uniref:Lipoprotein n=1 Tax=Natronorubrum bangense TaxID=61858 RepID=A0A4D6HKB4_9EURY|nr:hypothetical protein [Natronorubrum bangense]QCC53985.1 hypothetical protein DV706_05440 [Natronorubrum bangense]
MRPPRSRRSLLAAAIPSAVALAGCFEREFTSHDEPTDPGIVPPDRYDCADSDRPDPETLSHADDVEPAPYPSPPSSVSDGADQYVLEFEQAYRRNTFLETYGSEADQFEFRFQERQIDGIESDTEMEAVLASIVYDLTTSTRQTDASTERDTRVTYYVDENVVLRARYRGGLADEPSFDPDPRDAGDPVACFE